MSIRVHVDGHVDTICFLKEFLCKEFSCQPDFFHIKPNEDKYIKHLYEKIFLCEKTPFITHFLNIFSV